LLFKDCLPDPAGDHHKDVFEIFTQRVDYAIGLVLANHVLQSALAFVLLLLFTFFANIVSLVARSAVFSKFTQGFECLPVWAFRTVLENSGHRHRFC
jgi:hypothetical protein